MEIRVYDEELNFKGLVENYSSLQWRRKYFDVGDYEIHAPLTKENVKLLKPNNLVWIKGYKEAGIIEYLSYKENYQAQEIVAKGRFLEAYLERRITKGTKNYKGKVEDVMLQLISSCNLSFILFADKKGYSDKISIQATYKNLLLLIKKIAKASGVGFRVSPDFKKKALLFECYKGEDKSTKQFARNRVIFSQEYNNLTSCEYTFSNQKYKTLAIVGGEGKGEERVYVTVGGGNDLNLREVFVDAKDLRSKDLTPAKYKDLLRKRGEEVLQKNSIIESLESEVNGEGNFIYKKHYDLGDIVTIKNSKWNLLQHLRIVEVQEVCENEHLTIIPVFGNPLPTTLSLN